MKYKEDWEQAKKRLTALWEQEIVDRCCINIECWKDGIHHGAAASPKTPDEKYKFWIDEREILEKNIFLFENTIYGGEAFPHISAYLGAGGHAGFFKNAKYTFEEETVWFAPIIEDWERDAPVFDPESFLYKKTLEHARFFSGYAKGDFFVSMPDCTGNADALAHLRSSEELLVDMLTDEETVLQVLAKMQAAYEKAMVAVYDLVKENNEGGSVVGWLNTWAPGFHAQMQSDISVMISPVMFERFILPELERQCSLLDFPLYHFDGIEQIKHLDMLLSLKKLRMIQWTSVAGQPSPACFISELKRIQAAGKSLHLTISNEAELEALMEQLSSRGLYLSFSRKLQSEEELKAFLKKVEKLTHE